MKPTKRFDCVEMKRRAQEQIRKDLEGKSREEEIEYFRRGSDEFKRRIDDARSRKAEERTQ
ncbi:hypothetical protein B7486_07910 [cyanobacterium TDX16]|nr:hypothetical protein B7486_07910 [cyanobacterium TDX16]